MIVVFFCFSMIFISTASVFILVFFNFSLVVVAEKIFCFLFQAIKFLQILPNNNALTDSFQFFPLKYIINKAVQKILQNFVDLQNTKQILANSADHVNQIICHDNKKEIRFVKSDLCLLELTTLVPIKCRMTKNQRRNLRIH